MGTKFFGLNLFYTKLKRFQKYNRNTSSTFLHLIYHLIDLLTWVPSSHSRTSFQKVPTVSRGGNMVDVYILLFESINHCSRVSLSL